MKNLEEIYACYFYVKNPELGSRPELQSSFPHNVEDVMNCFLKIIDKLKSIGHASISSSEEFLKYRTKIKNIFDKSQTKKTDGYYGYAENKLTTSLNKYVKKCNDIINNEAMDTDFFTAPPQDNMLMFSLDTLMSVGSLSDNMILDDQDENDLYDVPTPEKALIFITEHINKLLSDNLYTQEAYLQQLYQEVNAKQGSIKDFLKKRTTVCTLRHVNKILSSNDEIDDAVLQLLLSQEYCRNLLLSGYELNNIKNKLMPHYKANKALFDEKGVTNLLHALQKQISAEDFIEFIDKYFQKTKDVQQFSIACLTVLRLGKTDYLKPFLMLLSKKSYDQIDVDLISGLIQRAEQAQSSDMTLDDITARFSTPAPDVVFQLSEDEISDIKRQHEQVYQYRDQHNKLTDLEIEKKLADVKAALGSRENLEEKKLEILALIYIAFQRAFYFQPFKAQLFNVLALANSQNHRRLTQIKTGEGKSIIIAFLAAWLALTENKKVHIVTSSGDLAKRDANKNKKFYNLLGLNCSHNVDKIRDTGVYQNHIVYGRAYDFEFTWLYEKLGSLDEGSISLEALILDEVDNMFVDHQTSAGCITQTIFPSLEQKKYQKAYDIVKQYHLAEGKHITSEVFNEKFEEFLSEIKLDEWLSELYESKFEEDSWSENKKYLVYNSAKKAFEWEMHNQFTVLDKQVCYVDCSTGDLRPNSRWPHGLHEMLEYKSLQEGKDINPYLVPINVNQTSYLSQDFSHKSIASSTHIDFFNRYDEVYGLSGTLGDSAIRKQLKTLYNVDSYDSPMQRPPQKKEMSHYIGSTLSEKENYLLATVCQMVEQKRPVLIICETIAASIDTFKFLKNKIGNKINLQQYHGLQQKSVNVILSQAGTPGSVLVGTILAGRGADIVTTPEAESGGGLHVIAFFLPPDERIEEQIFGRTGRQGKKGTYHYIVVLEEVTKEIPNIDLTGCSSDDVIALWRLVRKTRCQQKAEDMIAGYPLRSLLQIAQSFLFSIPKDQRKKYQERWMSLFEEINDYIEYQIEKNPKNIDSILVSAKKFIADKLEEFTKNLASFENTTALHYVANRGKRKLTTLFLEAQPERLNEYEEKTKQTPEQLFPKNSAKFLRKFTSIFSPPVNNVNEQIIILEKNENKDSSLNSSPSC